jgi:hypothetical protein
MFPAALELAMAIGVPLALAVTAGAQQATRRPAPAPAWTQAGATVAADAIPEADHAYLAAWVAAHEQPVDQYMLSLFTRHDVVVVGEAHNLREHKDLVLSLMPRLYHEAGVRVIGWEFTNPSGDAELERLVTAPTFDYPAQLDFARRQGSHAWAYKEHWDFIEAVRALNAGLPAGAPKMRFVGIDKEIDWVGVYTAQKTVAKDSPEAGALLELQQQREVEMAANAERETFAKGQKALLFVGSGHAETHLGLPPAMPYRRPIMAQVLYKKYGDRVYHVCPDSGQIAVMNRALQHRKFPIAAFDLHASPFANILSTEWGGVPRPLSEMVRGFVYFGPRASLHRNTFIEGFVTDEMFEKYGGYYRIDFGRDFQNAAEVNAYFRERALSPLK